MLALICSAYVTSKTREATEAWAFRMAQGQSGSGRGRASFLPSPVPLAHSRRAEVLFLRKQLAFFQERQVQPRRLNDSARFSLILWSRLCNWKEALVIVKPETLIGWHRKSFQLFWKGKSQAGRPRIPENIRNLIVQNKQTNWYMSVHNGTDTNLRRI